MAAALVQERPRLPVRMHLAPAGTRVAVAGSLGLLVSGIVAGAAPWQAAVLTGWDTAAAVFVAWVVWMAYGKDGAATAMLATREDDSRTAADLVLVAASLASLAAVGLGLVKASHERGTAQGAVTALALASVVLSWAAVHAVLRCATPASITASGGASTSTTIGSRTTTTSPTSR